MTLKLSLHSQLYSKGHAELIQDRIVLDIPGIVKQNVASSGLLWFFFWWNVLQPRASEFLSESRLIHPGLFHVLAVKGLMNLPLFIENCVDIFRSS